uniref:C-X3-C motif chemokine ligand 1 n=1 Tax=Gorilla gorilla gorilla TaxID=9595 RepID=A0A2I2YNW3_GORGO
MALISLSWLLRLATFCHLTVLLAAWRRDSTGCSVPTRRSNGSRTRCSIWTARLLP